MRPMLTIKLIALGTGHGVRLRPVSRDVISLIPPISGPVQKVAKITIQLVLAQLRQGLRLPSLLII